MELTRPQIDAAWHVNRGFSTAFPIAIPVHAVTVHGMEFKDILLNTKQRGTQMTWRLSGTWKGTIYDSQGVELHSDLLEYRAIPVTAQPWLA